MDEPVTASAPQPALELNALMREMDALVNGVRAIVADLSRPWKGNLLTPTGWRQLHEATYSESFTIRLPAEAITKLRTSCAAWQRRYTKLRFLTATRPVWNT